MCSTSIAIAVDHQLPRRASGDPLRGCPHAVAMRWVRDMAQLLALATAVAKANEVIVNPRLHCAPECFLAIKLGGLAYSHVRGVSVATGCRLRHARRLLGSCCQASQFSVGGLCQVSPQTPLSTIQI